MHDHDMGDGGEHDHDGGTGMDGSGMDGTGMVSVAPAASPVTGDPNFTG
jgi:hypothetical protein